MYTKEEKKAYFQALRDRWNEAKELSKQKGKEIDAIIASHGLNISPTSYMLVYMQMEAKGLDGLPYLDMKTFAGWK